MGSIGQAPCNATQAHSILQLLCRAAACGAHTAHLQAHARHAGRQLARHWHQPLLLHLHLGLLHLGLLQLLLYLHALR
jgi:hypothetical protein